MLHASFNAGTEVWLHGVHYRLVETYQDEGRAWNAVLETDDTSRRVFLIEKLFEEMRLLNLRLAPPKQRAKDLERKPRRFLSAGEARALNASDTAKRGADIRQWVLNYLAQRRLQVRSISDWEAARQSFETDKPSLASEPTEDRTLIPDKFPSLSSIKRWLSRFSREGKNGLIPRTQDRGGKGRARVDAAVVDRIQHMIDNYYCSEQRRSMRDCWLQLVGEIVKENSQALPCDQIRRPSYATFRRYVAKRPGFEVYASRHGRRAAEYRYRSTYTKSGEPKAFNEEWQVDNFLLRVVGMSEDGTMPRGRAWVTIITETSTRAIVGLRVGYETLTSERQLQCLHDAIMPKDHERLAKMGVVGRWVVCGAPIAIRMDNGSDYRAEDFAQALRDLGIEAVWCPVGTPWAKGQVERLIRTAHSDMQGLVGSVLPPAVAKSFHHDRDPKCKPSDLMLMKHSEIEAAVFRWAIDEYMNKPHTALGNKSPRDKWELVATPESCELPCEPELLMVTCMNRCRVTIQNHGVHIAGLRSFNSPMLQDIRRTVEHTREEAAVVEVRYRPSLLDKIYVQDPRNKSWFELLNHDPATSDLSQTQVEMLRREENLTTSATSSDYAAARKANADRMRAKRNSRNRAWQKWTRESMGLHGPDGGPDASAAETATAVPTGPKPGKPRKPTPSVAASPSPQSNPQAARNHQATRTAQRDMVELEIPEFEVN